MAAANPFALLEVLPPGPSRHLAAVTPNDDNDLPFLARYLWVGSGGNIEIINAQGDMVIFMAVPTGYKLEIGDVKRVRATNTTAQNIVAME